MTKLEKRFGSWAIPNLAIYLIALQAIGYFMLIGGYADYNDLSLIGSKILHQGEWWRFISFLMLPKASRLIWIIISFLVFYFIGGALERQWGVFRFNLYLLSGYVLTGIMSFIDPGAVIPNFYFLTTVLFAFATLFPNYEFYMFFVLPVKVKWIAWIMAVAFVLTLFQSAKGSGAAYIVGNKLGIAAAFLNYGLFFGKDFVRGLRSSQRRKAFVAENTKVESMTMHECAQCGITDKSDPNMHFRYCSACGSCFCEAHISSHEH